MHSPFNAPGGGCEAAGDQTKWSPFARTKKPALEEAGLCGQWDNYRTNFDDFRAVYLFGIQTDIE